MNSSKSSETGGFFLNIFHDPENCYCPREICGDGSSAVKIRNVVLKSILAAFTKNRGFTFEIDPIKDVSLVWYFVLHLSSTNPFHPTAAFIRNLGQEIKLIDPGQKKDAVDNKIKSLLMEFGTQFNGYTETRKKSSIVVLIAGDGDYQCEINSLRHLGVKIILLHRPNDWSASLRNLIEEGLSLGIWDSIIESARYGHYGLPMAPNLGINGQSLPPGFDTSGLPLAPNLGINGQSLPPGFDTSGLPLAPNLGINGQSLPPGFGTSGLPLAPNLRTNRQSLPPGFKTSGLPLAPNLGINGQSLPPGFDTSGLPLAPNLGINGQSLPPGFKTSGLPLAPNLGINGQSLPPGFKTSGLPLAPNLGINGQSLPPGFEINEINLYLSYPDIKDRVQTIGLKNLCDSSHGTLSYSKGPEGQIISIHASVVDALKVFIRNRRGRITAQDVDLFYKEWPNLKTIRKRLLGGYVQLQDLCESVDGFLFEYSSDKIIGYGYICCVGAPPANYDLIMTIVRFVISVEEKVSQESEPLTEIVKFTKTQFLYASKYLKSEIGAKLTDICRNVEIGWEGADTSIEVRYLQKFIDQDTITTYQNDLNSCKRYLESVKANLVMEPKTSNIALSKTDLKFDIELKNLLRDKQVYMHIALRVACPNAPKPVYSLIMYFPEHWGSNEEALRQRISTKVQTILKLKQPTQVIVGRIISIYQPHALITVESDQQKVFLLKTNCSNDEVKFECLHNDEVDVTLVCPKSYYNWESDCVWSNTVLDQIKKLERVGPKKLSDNELAAKVFPNSADAFRQKILKNFMGFDVAYKILLSNVVNKVAQVIKRNDPGSSDIFLGNLISVRKDLDGVELTGLQKYVELAEKFLLIYIKSIMVKVVNVSYRKRNNESMFLAVESRFSSIAADGLDTGDADGAVSVRHSNSTSEARIPCKIFIDSPNKEYVGIVALPECRSLWKRMTEEVQGLVNSFLTNRIPMKKRMYIPCDEIKNKFGLVKCSVDKRVINNVVVFVSGKKSSVDNASDYIIKMFTGETYDNLKVSCPGELGGADAAHYLRLPGVRQRIIELCKSVKVKYPRFSATVSDTSNGDNDSSVLTLRGPPDSVSTVVDFALDGVREILRDTKLYSLTLPEHEVQWLIRNGGDIGAGIDVWIRLGRSESMECPPDDVNDSSMPSLNMVHNIGSLQVFVAEKDFKNLSSFGCDTIVNPANCNLSHIGGLAKSIADEAGQSLVNACSELLNSRLDRVLMVGEAVTTAAFNLTMYKHIVHVVAPSIQVTSPTFDQRAILRDCIYKALQEAAKVESTCLAIPGVGAGIFSWPASDSANEIVRAIKNWVMVDGAKQDCSLKKVVLFDSNVNMVAAFSLALELLENESGSTSSNLEALPSSEVNLVNPPGPPPTVPAFRWFWKLWDRWEPVPATACDYTHDGNVVKIVPYDYDQVLQMEGQYALDSEGSCLLQGDLSGIRNCNDYNISFRNMTQTTVERVDKPNTRWSERPIFRLPSDACSVPLPLFEERVQEYSKRVADYDLYLATVTSAETRNETTKQDVSDAKNDGKIKIHNIGSLQVFVAEKDFKNLSSFGCDTIVNPANCNLSHIGGLAKSIADEAGQSLVNACSELLNSRLDRVLMVGEAVTTAAFNLTMYKHIVHVVAPSIQVTSPTFDQRAILRDCIYKALQEAVKVESTCLAIPGVGAGIFSWPASDSANEIVRAIKKWVMVDGAKQDCSLKKVVLFDSNVNMVAAFSLALELLENESGSTSSNLEALPSSEVNLVNPPGPPPTLPAFRWFWKLWDRWEPVPATACDYTHDGNVVKIVPYDYDQVLQMEGQYALDSEGSCLLQGDLSGIRNCNDYNISFRNMTQTTVERVDKPNTRWSERPIFRLPSDACSVPLPLFEERVQEYSKRVADYDLYLATVTSAETRNETTKQDMSDAKNDGDIKMPPVEDLSNVFIFGKEEAFLTAKESIIAAISEGRHSQDMILTGLKTTDMCLDIAVQELSERLQAINSEITVVTGTPWKVSIRAMGEMALDEAIRLVKQYENEKIIEHHQIPLPPNWSPMVEDEYNETPKPILVEVVPGSDEYQKAVEVLLNSPNGVFNAKIIKIERVQNVDLYNSYYKKCREIAKINAGNSNVIRLKHGTRQTDPRQIWESGTSTGKYGFDFRFSLLKDKQNFYGNGSYFAEDFSYSDRYAFKQPDGSRQMFIALVCCGQIDQRSACDRDIVAPAAPYSSVRGPIQNEGFIHYGIVVYLHHQSYPEYLVTYVNN